MISNVFDPKKPLIFSCNVCHFSSCNKKDYNKHIQTKKIFSMFRNVFQSKKRKKPHMNVTVVKNIKTLLGYGDTKKNVM